MSGSSQEHYETGQIIFNQDDIGDRLYIVIKGCCEVVRTDDGVSKRLAQLGPGQYFGEMALLSKSMRFATVRAIEPLDVLSVPRHDLSAMLDYLPALRESFQEVVARREAMNMEDELRNGKRPAMIGPPPDQDHTESY